VDVEDPFAEEEEVFEEYGLHLTKKVADDYDAVIITVPHQQYVMLDEKDFAAITKNEALIADLKGVFKNKINNRKYWSL
ncbi:MAG: nucleotide sugar dehydrogenase, partial [Bacteroidetes bacterium]|nr:nucleotide sugar dehydrogenase [Bacteroidota bacterium]